MGLRTFTRVGIVLYYGWHYCSPVFRLPTRWAWDLIYCLHPSYRFTVVSSLSLDMWYLFLVVLLLIVVKLLGVG